MSQYFYDWRFYKIKKVIEGQTESKYHYDEVGNLIEAENTYGQFVFLEYDDEGHITRLRDQANRLLYFEMDQAVKRPRKVTLDGIGDVFISYDKNGAISNVVSLKGNATLITSVYAAINNLLDITSPACVLQKNKCGCKKTFSRKASFTE